MLLIGDVFCFFSVQQQGIELERERERGPCLWWMNFEDRRGSGVGEGVGWVDEETRLA